MKIPSTQVFSHQLVLREGLALTPKTLKDGLDLMKVAGYAGAVVVPAAWHKSLNAKLAAEIAVDTDMQLQTCGFLPPGKGFNPYTKAGIRKAHTEICRQIAVQRIFADAGCGSDLFCGPIDIEWKSAETFELEKYFAWIQRLDELADEEGFWLAIEPLNPTESHVPDAFTTLRKAIVSAASNNRIFIQFDTGHAHSRGVTISDFAMMIRQIKMFEFANVGRHPLQTELGIDFATHIKHLHLLDPECRLSAEPFDPEGVIKPLGLGELCTTTTPGVEAMKLDADFLKQQGIMS